jgi:kinase
MSDLSTCHLFPLPALVVLLLTCKCRAQPVTGDRDTLLTVKDWAILVHLDSWEPTEDHCRWSDDMCASGIVMELSFPSMNLNGLMSASLCALKSLAWLDLSYNNLTGVFLTIPFYACAKLRYLDLSNNFFSGPLPVDIDNHSTAMEHLNLSSNRFSSEVPMVVAWLPALKTLVLDTNHLCGRWVTGG